MKELPLNQNPFIRVLPQYAFLDAIINNEHTNINKICSIDVIGLKKQQWIYNVQNAEMQIDDNTINLFRKGYGIKAEGGGYRYLDKGEEIIFKLQYQQYSNRWDGITLFMSIPERFEFAEEMNWNYKLCIHCCGSLRIDVDGKMLFYQDNKENKDVPKWYKMTYNHDNIMLFNSWDGITWNLLYQVESVPFCAYQNLVSGFYFFIHENQYHKWLCNNFIQIKYNAEDGKTVDYLGFMNRDWKNYAIHPLIKFSYDKKSQIDEWGIWNYVIGNIDNKRYLEIWLNEYYIKGTNAYQKYQYIHESLIYGYDSVCRTVKLLSICKGKPRVLVVSIELIKQAWEKACENNDMIRTFEFSPDENGYEIDICHIYNQIKDYLSGRNTSSDYQYLAQKEQGVFGINIYAGILDNDMGRERFLKDKKAAYIIKEHKTCMLFRVAYLYERGTITDKDYASLKEQIQEIESMAEILLALVLKNQVLNRVTTQDKIWELLRCIKEKEEICYREFLHVLESQSNVWC